MCGLKPLSAFIVDADKESHPSWVCGLKLDGGQPDIKAIGVTSFVGVWIETLLGGLFGKSNTVTSFVGVWIETLTLGDVASGRGVTSFVGVWIETLSSFKYLKL